MCILYLILFNTMRETKVFGLPQRKMFKTKCLDKMFKKICIFWKLLCFGRPSTNLKTTADPPDISISSNLSNLADFSHTWTIWRWNLRRFSKVKIKVWNTLTIISSKRGYVEYFSIFHFYKTAFLLWESIDFELGY